jgi:hypothetical protein
MGRRSKKSKKSKQRRSKTGMQKQYSSTENVAYYFLAAIGIVILICAGIALLEYFKIF